MGVCLGVDSMEGSRGALGVEGGQESRCSLFCLGRLLYHLKLVYVQEVMRRALEGKLHSWRSPRVEAGWDHLRKLRTVTDAIEMRQHLDRHQKQVSSNRGCRKKRVSQSDTCESDCVMGELGELASVRFQNTSGDI